MFLVRISDLLQYSYLRHDLRLTLSKPFTVYPVRADRDLSSTTSIEATTVIRAATGTAPLAYIMRATSELEVEPNPTCELCLKHTCRDERNDCERVGAGLQSEPRSSYAHRTSVFRASNRPGLMKL